MRGVYGGGGCKPLHFPPLNLKNVNKNAMEKCKNRKKEKKENIYNLNICLIIRRN